MSDTFSITQLVTIAVFLSALIGMMVLVRRFKEPLSKQLGGQRRIKLMEDTSIGTHERAKLIEVDGQSFLIISAKNQPPAIVPFDETHGSKPTVIPTSIPKQAKASGANTPSNAPFLEAMKQARRRNPNLGLDQS
ncbi:MAG: hypothetical protein ACPHW3_06170 [Candidatus Puniceispirillales bacterium]